MDGYEHGDLLSYISNLALKPKAQCVKRVMRGYWKIGGKIDDKIGLYLLEALIHAVLNSANWVLE